MIPATNNGVVFMARKIKETPILTGKDARAFEKAIEANRNKKVTSSEYHRAENTYKRIIKASGLG